MTVYEMMKKHEHLIGKPVKDSAGLSLGKFFGICFDGEGYYYAVNGKDGKFMYVEATTALFLDTSKGVHFQLETGYYE